MAAAEGVSTNTNKLNWLKSHGSDLLNSSSACKVLQLSSDKFFSLLSNSFDDKQTSSMEDYIETSVVFFQYISIIIF